MIGGLYVARRSRVHAAAPGLKLAVLALAGTGLFLVRGPLPLVGALLAVLTLYPLARLPLALAWRQLRPAFAMLAILALVQLWTAGALAALTVTLRFAALILLAALLTATTRTTALVETLERALGWLRPFGADPAKVGLAISLAIRFIPALGTVAQEVREAQRARGMERGCLTLGPPLIVRTLKMADEIADAIDARS